MRLIAPFVLIIAALIATVYLDDTPADADLVFVNRGDVFTLDPQRQSYLQDFRMTYALFEGLVRWDNSTFEVEPASTERFEVSPDGLEYTFHIRPDARWSNGAPVTAHDFVYSWMRLLLPDTVADYSNLIFCIDGAPAFWDWRTQRTEAYRDGSQKTADAAEAMWDETATFFREHVAVRAESDRTLRVTLSRPTAYFLDLLAFGVCYPVYRPSVEGWDEQTAEQAAAHPRGWIGVTPPPWSSRRWASINPDTGGFEQQHQWARPGSIVSNGPYVLAEWRYKRDMRLERNESYHSPHRAKSDSIVAVTIEDTNTRVLAFESGTLDWLSEVGAEYESDMLAELAAYKRRHADTLAKLVAGGLSEDEAMAQLPPPERGERRDIHVFPTFGTDFYSFNCRPNLSDGKTNPFADPAVRRAFTLAVDKQAIVSRVTRLNEPVATTLIPPNSIPGYTSPAGLPHDLDRARRELAAAGWEDRDGDGLIEKDGETFPPIDLLWTTNTPRYKWISLELKAQWEAAFGVIVELRGTDTKFYKEDLKQGKFMIARGRWYGDYGDPTTFLELNRTGDGNNDREYTNPVVDDLLDRAAVEADPAARMELLHECERIIVEDDVPILMLCQLVQVYMYEPGRLKGLTDHPRLVQYLWQMEATDE